ncbi:carbohydrate-binding module family 1 protein [Pyrenophora tritici-repentis]|uniref:Carbohydrate-binding module family 1 protein n=1 Tax=Pyrenophora tritici-repentis TaxID=45151 RepID=A0A2W1H4U8_9PLEO|nr:Carbohydrate-binding module family 1 protein [Pyrenophora tritici-repentis]KAF7449173.1 Carbohydrate-binding module family 1 protein [Pyrenophora tritici-repentis]KAF7570824.1 solute binding protein [Pyrenophora tritici-repentis]KAG9383886.1 Carbohydrate-binding module family 1 protein [Pyrenophora tritici-repentis]KAI0589104.1 Carbohydrate-binding module family 1 protein [Pyrenophora tritici-repentis]
MQLVTLTVLLSSLSAICVAIPADNQPNLVPRQTTYLITCIGGRCTDNISRPTPVVPQPTTKTKTVTTTTKKPDPTKSSAKPEPITSEKPEPVPYPTKTTIKTSTKSIPKPTKTTSEETGPISTACPVPVYYKCGGTNGNDPWTGCTKCVKGAKCVIQNQWYHQCVYDDDPNTSIAM